MDSNVSESVSPSGLNIFNEKEFRIVMVGKTGAGKSATGNTILGREVFESRFSPKSLTEQCAKVYGEVDGQKLSLIDTPGLFDTRIIKAKTLREVAKSVSYASPGPHVFLVIIKLDRFTEEEKETVQKIQEVFGADADRYSMVLFTHGDLLKGTTIEDFLKESEELQELVARCNNQYHVFNNDLKDRSQVKELLHKIRKIREKNRGHHYTSEMFQAAERAIQVEQERIRKETEEKRLKEQEAERKKIEAKYKEQIKKMAADREKAKQLIEAQQREIKEKQEEIRRQQEIKMRHQAENSGGILGMIMSLVQTAIRFYLETRK